MGHLFQGATTLLFQSVILHHFPPLRIVSRLHGVSEHPGKEGEYAAEAKDHNQNQETEGAKSDVVTRSSS